MRLFSLVVFVVIGSPFASPAFAVTAAGANCPRLPASVIEVVQVDHGSTSLAPAPESDSSALISLFGIGWLFFRRRI